MPTPVQLVTGLAGAIGCDFRRAQNQLVFVEYAGKLSRLNLFRTGSVVSSGSTVLKGTFNFDLDTGVEGGTGPTVDIWWEQKTAVLRDMAPMNTAQIVNLGAVDFNSLTPDVLSSLTYATTPIDGNNDPSNKLVTGDVFAVVILPRRSVSSTRRTRDPDTDSLCLQAVAPAFPWRAPSEKAIKFMRWVGGVGLSISIGSSSGKMIAPFKKEQSEFYSIEILVLLQDLAFSV